jgi:Transposase IS116/IS110/IS902 family
MTCSTGIHRAHGAQATAMKFVEPRPFVDPKVVARKLIELANAFEPVQDGRIYIEKVNGPFLFELKGTPAEYKAGLDRAIASGWLLHESGTYVRFTEAGAQLIFSGHWRDRKAVARYAGLTGSPDESGSRRRERGLARAGNVRVRSGMIQLAWRFVRFQKNSALAQWFAARTADGRASTRKTMIVALARKLLIALWRLVTRGEVPQGVVLRPAS